MMFHIQKLQQYLPFTVLKLIQVQENVGHGIVVATVLTVYGIETSKSSIVRLRVPVQLQQYLPFTVLKLS